jgi:hypothetical protein
LSAGLLNTIIAAVTLVGLAWVLYRPRVQESAAYKGTVVPLASIMDVGFIVFSPIIILLVGWGAPLAMFGLCMLGILTAYAFSYNIRHYEPLVDKPDPLHAWESSADWALIAASIVNNAYYALLLTTLVLLPLGDLYSVGLAATTAAAVLAGLTIYGFARGLEGLNEVGNRTTAFNLSAITAVLVAFAVYNVQQLVGGDFHWPDYDPAGDADTLRKLLGLFALVQGFEASRYLGAYLSADKRIETMRAAQYIASVAFVLFIALTLVLFTTVEAPRDATAIFVVSEQVSVFLPFLIMAVALGSQLSAIVNGTESRADLLAQKVGDRVPRRWTIPLILVPSIILVLLTDVDSAVALASRTFAAYYLLQAYIAGRIAWRARSWGWVAFFIGLGLAMAAIAILGIPSSL